MQTTSRAFLDQWNVRCGAALHDALAFLAGHDAAPYPDGVLGDWVATLRALHFEERHVPLVLSLLEKRDPWLMEAGLRLTARALALHEDPAAFESRIVRILGDDALEPWVLLSVVELLERCIGPSEPSFTEVYRALATLTPPRGRRIARNRHIDPMARLVPLYEQLLLQARQPSVRDLVILPAVEARHGTRGFRATVESILARMGLDRDQHWKALG